MPTADLGDAEIGEGAHPGRNLRVDVATDAGQLGSLVDGHDGRVDTPSGLFGSLPAGP
jgi:hypothetical protein